jgi:hypothetical protein
MKSVFAAARLTLLLGVTEHSDSNAHHNDSTVNSIIIIAAVAAAPALADEGSSGVAGLIAEAGDE